MIPLRNIVEPLNIQPLSLCNISNKRKLICDKIYDLLWVKIISWFYCIYHRTLSNLILFAFIFSTRRGCSNGLFTKRYGELGINQLSREIVVIWRGSDVISNQAKYMFCYCSWTWPPGTRNMSVCIVSVSMSYVCLSCCLGVALSWCRAVLVYVVLRVCLSGLSSCRAVCLVCLYIVCLSYCLSFCLHVVPHLSHNFWQQLYQLCETFSRITVRLLVVVRPNDGYTCMCCKHFESYKEQWRSCAFIPCSNTPCHMVTEKHCDIR